MENEISTTPAGDTQIPPVTPPASVPAPPPAADLVIKGEVKSERELTLERELQKERDRALEAERKAAEFERDNQVLKSIPVAAPAPTVQKVKRKRGWTDPIISTDDETD